MLQLIFTINIKENRPNHKYFASDYFFISLKWFKKSLKIHEKNTFKSSEQMAVLLFEILL